MILIEKRKKPTQCIPSVCFSFFSHNEILVNYAIRNAIRERRVPSMFMLPDVRCLLSSTSLIGRRLCFVRICLSEIAAKHLREENWDYNVTVTLHEGRGTSGSALILSACPYTPYPRCRRRSGVLRDDSKTTEQGNPRAIPPKPRPLNSWILHPHLR